MQCLNYAVHRYSFLKKEKNVLALHKHIKAGFMTEWTYIITEENE